MFGLGIGELILIAVVALLAVGPDRLPETARSIGRSIRDLRRQTTDLTSTLEKDSDIGDAVRELRSAWNGTARALPKNRYELGRAIDQMTDDKSKPAKLTANSKDAPAHTKIPTGDHGDGAAPPTPDEGDSAQADDGMPRISAAPGIVARGAAPATEPATEGGAAEPAAAPVREDAAADASDSPRPKKPAHG